MRRYCIPCVVTGMLWTALFSISAGVLTVILETGELPSRRVFMACLSAGLMAALRAAQLHVADPPQPKYQQQEPEE